MNGSILPLKRQEEELSSNDGLVKVFVQAMKNVGFTPKPWNLNSQLSLPCSHWFAMGTSSLFSQKQPEVQDSWGHRENNGGEGLGADINLSFCPQENYTAGYQ